MFDSQWRICRCREETNLKRVVGWRCIWAIQVPLPCGVTQILQIKVHTLVTILCYHSTTPENLVPLFQHKNYNTFYFFFKNCNLHKRMHGTWSSWIWDSGERAWKRAWFQWGSFQQGHWLQLVEQQLRLQEKPWWWYSSLVQTLLLVLLYQ